MEALDVGVSFVVREGLTALHIGISKVTDDGMIDFCVDVVLGALRLRKGLDIGRNLPVPRKIAGTFIFPRTDARLWGR
ncbi:MAG: hypothetical protein CO108_13755 [Deltaproteobacteria bacterium CG_4_9_14_3_um_filter_63_12]|nr:MAG: hypothetical protein COW42_15575 [Deltaproteobacteria bacterium CG17_big_fil_post_rev_8_21_14_2_50_63_7]PJB40975.1 MAG: hypothetical protein CO108_13755 [Deltaproteobacteria bacterium CG_4_9_14_3_um_filter_63_12]